MSILDVETALKMPNGAHILVQGYLSTKDYEENPLFLFFLKDRLNESVNLTLTVDPHRCPVKPETDWIPGKIYHYVVAGRLRTLRRRRGSRDTERILDLDLIMNYTSFQSYFGSLNSEEVQSEPE